VNNSHFIVHLPQACRALALMLYVGPDAVMPLLSVLGAIAGGILMFWRRLSTLVRRVFRPSSAKQEVSSKTSK
jgi:hypothetical protein